MNKKYIVVIVILIMLILVQEFIYKNDINEKNDMQKIYLSEIYNQYKGKVKLKDLEKNMNKLSTNNYKMFNYNEYNSKEIKKAFERYKGLGFEDTQSVFTYIKSLKTISNKNNCDFMYIEVVPNTINKTDDYTELQLKLTCQSKESMIIILKLYNKINKIKIKL